MFTSLTYFAWSQKLDWMANNQYEISTISEINHVFYCWCDYAIHKSRILKQTDIHSLFILSILQSRAETWGNKIVRSLSINFKYSRLSYYLFLSFRVLPLSWVMFNWISIGHFPGYFNSFHEYWKYTLGKEREQIVFKF